MQLIIIPTIQYAVSAILSGTVHDAFKIVIPSLSISVPIEDRQIPKRNIFIPALEGYALNQDQPILQEMFYNLLKNSIDKTREEYNHPAFPKILGQLSKEELITLYRCYKICTDEKYALPPPMSTRISMDYTSVIISHLIGLGLMNVKLNIEAEPEYSIFNDYLDKKDSHIINVSKNEWIEMNPFGNQFIKACMSDETEELLKDLI